MRRSLFGELGTDNSSGCGASGGEGDCRSLCVVLCCVVCCVEFVFSIFFWFFVSFYVIGYVFCFSLFVPFFSVCLF